MYTIDTVSGAIIIHTKFHEDWYRRSSNIKVISQKCERQQCSYY
jgi:hypothetical protein